MSKIDTPLEFIGTSREVLSAFPLPVKHSIGFALRSAQKGGKHPDAKPLKRDSRASFTCCTCSRKNQNGNQDAQAEIDKIRRRLKQAEQASLERENEKGQSHQKQR